MDCLVAHFTLKNFSLNDPASNEVLYDASASLRWLFPRDYETFLRLHNGSEGFVGDSYLILWKAEDLRPFNFEYEVMEYAPGIILFGSSGGGEGYGFDTADPVMPVIRIPFVGMERSSARVVADTFTGFLAELAK